MHQWALKVHVPDASVSKTLTVSGESTVSEVTLKLVELLGKSVNSIVTLSLQLNLNHELSLY